MFNNKTLTSFFMFIILVNFNVAFSSTIESLQLTQILKDDTNGVDGLGNPRSVKILSDNSKVFVSSGDAGSDPTFSV